MGNQLIIGIAEYSVDNANPKLIFGVADPLIMYSGFPVNNPDNQF
jgi:hypothetical protein